MKVTIDRFEGKYAVCEKEDLGMIDIEIEKLPLEAREGDVLVIDGSDIRIEIEETEMRKERIEKLMNDLWE